MPDYLNTDTTRWTPVIKEGREDIVPKMTIVQCPSGGEWENLWLSQFLSQFMNLNFEVVSIPVAARAERVSLMFAAGDLPDIMANLALGTVGLVRYGVVEKQLLALDSYITPELTPEMYKDMQARPDAMAISIAPDGHIYSAPMLGEPDDEGMYLRLFLRQTWLDKLGLAKPRTLDEFIAMLRAFKEKDPGGVGKENVVPLAMNIGYYILNAYGFVWHGTAFTGAAPALKDGQAVIPANHPLFREYLATMNMMYNEGLMPSNVFTIEETEYRAMLHEGRAGMYHSPVYVTGLPTWDEWEAPYPLTSAHNDTPRWPTAPAARTGNYAVSARTKHPELCLRFANLFYGPDSRALWMGFGPYEPYAEMNLDRGVMYWDPERRLLDWDKTKFPADAPDGWTYLMAYWSGLMYQWGGYEQKKYYHTHIRKYHRAEMRTEKYFDLSNPDLHYRSTVYPNLFRYRTTTFPPIFYLLPESQRRLDELTTVITPYLTEQVALFVTGRRPLAEFDKFQQELKGLGIDELEAIYQQVWADHQRR
jgi:putative aldouronate transport system substrate-binding protein